MSNKVVAIDIGHDSLKIAYVVNGVLKTAVTEMMPDNFLRDDAIVSPSSMGELIRKVLKDNHIKCRNAAFIMNSESVFVKNIEMPVMTEEQLRYNLPFEFKDYITTEIGDYIFDYAMISTGKEIMDIAHGKVKNNSTSIDEIVSENQTPSMSLMAAAMPRKLLDVYMEIAGKAGLKLQKAIPIICSYKELIRRYSQNHPDKEFCIIDLGYRSVRIYMFTGENFTAERTIENGMSRLGQIIADEFNVDEHLARTYLLTDFNNCQSLYECGELYNSLAGDINRALNFYRFSYPDSALSDIWLCGGGSQIEAFQTVLANSLDVEIHYAEDLLPAECRIDHAEVCLQAFGTAL